MIINSTATMKNALQLLFTAAIFLSPLLSHGQCPAGRYLTDMFGVSKTTVTYSTPYSLLMDIYEPSGDVAATRPLIILAHGGSFVAGSRTDDVSVDSLCVRFARRGYVTASIDYRLGDAISMVTDSAYATETVIKAIGDGKAAIRYFVKDAATSNTYRIDTNNIYAGGNSAGAVLYMHVGYLSDISECPPHIVTAMAANGGFEGNSGNPGYSSKTKAIVNLAGALNTTSVIDPSDNASVNAHGTTDDVVPYNCGYPIGGSVHVNLCGLGALEPVYTAKGIYHWNMIFPGAGHIPWQSNATQFNSVDSLVKEFLYTLVCPGGASAASNIHKSYSANIYPNPAGDMINIDVPATMESVSIIDPTGRQVANYSLPLVESANINVSELASGLYFLHIRFADHRIAPLVQRMSKL